MKWVKELIVFKCSWDSIKEKVAVCPKAGNPLGAIESITITKFAGSPLGRLGSNRQYFETFFVPSKDFLRELPSPTETTVSGMENLSFNRNITSLLLLLWWIWCFISSSFTVLFTWCSCWHVAVPSHGHFSISLQFLWKCFPSAGDSGALITLYRPCWSGCHF